MKILPSDNSYKTFCNLVTGYRLLSAVMQAVELGIIDAVGAGGCSADQLLGKISIKHEEGERFLLLLVNIGVLERYDDRLFLSRFSRNFLCKDSDLSQLHALEFEKVLMDKWNGLGSVLTEGQGSNTLPLPKDEYTKRLALFQKSMGEAALVRSKELWEAVGPLPETGMIIDVGAGDGTYLAEFLHHYPRWRAVACDLSDVCAMGGSCPAGDAVKWDACNVADPKECADLAARYRGSASVLLLSNVIHCYGKSENVALLGQLQEMVARDGTLIIHDFFSDGNGFGAMYDLHMMVNTYNGRTYAIDETLHMLHDAGFADCQTVELPSLSHAILARREGQENGWRDPRFRLRREALSLGFFEAAFIDSAAISIEPWVKAKCQYGCSLYGRKWSCPPNSFTAEEFRELLLSYSWGIVVAGQPPLRGFQEKLLELEKCAFLGGFKKALVCSGGPCTWCETCDDQRCLFPEKRRPSLEACGCDVFALAESCGIKIAPVRNKDDFVQYIGLLLVE